MKQRKQIFNITLVLIIVLSMMNFGIGGISPAFGASDAANYVFDISEGNITITHGTTGLKVVYGDQSAGNTVDNITDNSTKPITIIGTGSDNKLTVYQSCYVVLSGVNITYSGDRAFGIIQSSNAAVDLRLDGSNTITTTAGGSSSTLYVDWSTSLTVSGTGTLSVNGGGRCIGIDGTLINNATIDAVSGTGGDGVTNGNTLTNNATIRAAGAVGINSNGNLTNNGVIIANGSNYGINSNRTLTNNSGGSITAIGSGTNSTGIFILLSTLNNSGSITAFGNTDSINNYYATLTNGGYILASKTVSNTSATFNGANTTNNTVNFSGTVTDGTQTVLYDSSDSQMGNISNYGVNGSTAQFCFYAPAGNYKLKTNDVWQQHITSPSTTPSTAFDTTSMHTFDSVEDTPTIVPSAPPTAAPTNLVLSTSTSGQTGLSFTASASAEKYLIVKSSGSEPTFVPTATNEYTTSSVITGGTVVYAGNLTSFTDMATPPGTQYFYKIYAYNGTGASAAYYTSQALDGSIISKTGSSGTNATLNTDKQTTADFPDAGIKVNFPQGTNTTLTVTKNVSVPSSNFYGSLPGGRTPKALYFNVTSTPNASAGTYSIVLDFSSIVGTQTQAESFKLMKRPDANSKWVDISSYVTDRQTDGVWGKFTVTGLTSFSQFAGCEAAVTYTVTSAADSGAGSLRNMLAAAQAGDIIQFNTTSMGGNKITLASPLNINQDITIIGADNGIILDGNNGNRVITVGVGCNVRLENLKIQNGNDAGNVAGGIYNGGNLYLVNCVVSGNSATGTYSSGGYTYGGVGGILQDAADTNLYITNSTIANNTGAGSSDGAGGILVADGYIEIYNSIIYGNIGQYNNTYFCTTTGGIKSYYSLYGNANAYYSSTAYTNSDAILAGDHNIFSQDPRFVSSGSDSFMIYGVSPCVDTGSNIYAVSDNDIRGTGFGRKLDKTNGAAGTIDMGAYEYKQGVDLLQPLSATPTATTTTVAKTSAVQTTVNFTLTNSPALTGTWVVYDAASGTSVPAGVTVSVTGSTLTLTNATDILAGDYYITVTESGKTESTRLKLTVGAYIPGQSTNPTATTTTVAKTSAVQTTVNFTLTNSPALTGTWAVYDAASGISVPAGITVSVTGSALTLTNATDISAGDYYITVTESGKTESARLKLTVGAYVAQSSGSSGGGRGSAAVAASNSVSIQVNGVSQSAATENTSVVDSRIVTTVTVDDDKVNAKLASEGNKTVVTIPVNKTADVVIGQLNGQTVKNMEQKEAVLEIKTEQVTYTLPAAQINIDDISNQIGTQTELKDIKVNISIATPPTDTVKVVQNTADKNSYQIVVKPVAFEITCTSGSKTVDVSKFNGYVERTIAIPDNVDPSKITTGIVLNSDGTFSHVPTTIVNIDGKYYAKINSLTNSTYSVIWNPKAFKDMENHWAKTEVNDMGSRLIINGVTEETFEPDRNITRAEFSAIIVKALGLMRPGTGKASFTDVTKDAWYYDAVSIASEYGIILGYGNGKFGPMDKVTREQAMVMIAKAMKITGLKAEFKAGEIDVMLSGYGDFKEAADWANESMAACIKTGILSGKNNKTLAPKDEITRAEVAVIARRLLQKSGLI